MSADHEPEFPVDNDRADPDLAYIQSWEARERADDTEQDHAGNQHTYPDDIRP